MSDCCDPSGYRRFFNTKEAKRHARSYQRKGLDSTEGPMVDALSNSLDGKSLLVLWPHTSALDLGVPQSSC